MLWTVNSYSLEVFENKKPYLYWEGNVWGVRLVSQFVDSFQKWRSQRMWAPVQQVYNICKTLREMQLL